MTSSLSSLPEEVKHHFHPSARWVSDFTSGGARRFEPRRGTRPLIYLTALFGASW